MHYPGLSGCHVDFEDGFDRGSPSDHGPGGDACGRSHLQHSGPGGPPRRGARRRLARSTDRAWTTAGDADGFHLLVADAADGYRWRTAATLSEPGVETDQWIGNACVTGSGRRAVVVYAPRTFTNREALFDRGGFTAVVDLRHGVVRKLRSVPAWRTSTRAAGRRDRRAHPGRRRGRAARPGCSIWTPRPAPCVRADRACRASSPRRCRPGRHRGRRPGAVVRVDAKGVRRVLAPCGLGAVPAGRGRRRRRGLHGAHARRRGGPADRRAPAPRRPRWRPAR